MKFYYPKDMNGNVIGFKTPESQVYDKNNKSLTDKLTEIYSGAPITSVSGYKPQSSGKKGLVTISSDYGVTHLGNSIEFHTEDNQTSTTRLFLNDYGDLHLNSEYATDISFIKYDKRGEEETDINKLLVTGIYASKKFINYPEQHLDSQGTVIVLNYSGNASILANDTMGEDNIWLTQIFVSPHSYKMWKRYVCVKFISPWVSTSTTELIIYDSIDVISLVENQNSCPDYSTTRFYLLHPTNMPIDTTDYIIDVFRLTVDVIKITAHQMRGNGMWIKQKIDGIWHEWKEIQTTSVS